MVVWYSDHHLVKRPVFRQPVEYWACLIQAGLPDLSQARLPNTINAAWRDLMPLDIKRQDMYLP